MAEGYDRVAPGVYRLDGLRLPYAVSVFLIEGDDGWTLVDAGVAGSEGRIRTAVGALAGGPGALRRIVLTHHHPDHVGALPGLRVWAPGAEVLASPQEAAIVRGARRPDPASNRVLRAVMARQRSPTTSVDRELGDGEVVAGFRVVPTPGHTAGHRSLLRDRDGVLLTGDAFGSISGPLRRLRIGVYRAICTDPAAAQASADRLLGEEFAVAAFSHGAPMRSRAKERLREVTRRYR